MHLNPSNTPHHKYLTTMGIRLFFMCICAILSLTANINAQDVLISNIEVEGTSQLETAQILNSLESRIFDPLDRKKISRDIHTIYNMGLFEDVKVEVEMQEEGYILRFIVLERPRVTELHFEGMKLLSVSDLDEELTIKKMDIYDPVKINENERLIENAYRKAGYAKVVVTSRVDKMTKQKYAVYFIVQESPRVFLTDIQVKGTEVYSELDIRRFILSTEIDCFSWMNDSGVFQEEKINQDLALITQHYLKLGYIKVFIQKPDVTIYRNPEFSRLEVKLDITEGPQYFTGKIDITGDILGVKEKLMELLKLKEGDVYNPFLQNQDRAVLNEAYQEQGYAFVRIIPRPKIDDDKRLVDVTYHIIKGEKAYISRLDIAGNAETRDYVIRREFEVGEGELYNGKKLRISQQNLQRLGFFEQGIVMEKNALEEEDNNLNILTRLKEAQTGTFQAQLGYSDQTRLSGGISLSKGNLFGRGQTIRLSAQFSEQDIRNDYSITFIEPRLWGSSVSTSVFVSQKRRDDNTDLNRGTIEENSYGFSFGLPVYYKRFRLSTRLNAVDRLFKKNEPSVIKRSIAPTLSYDVVNHPIFPSEGFKTSLTISHTGTPLGGSTRFREYFYHYQHFWSLNEGRTLIVMARARLGFLEKLGDFDIPSEDRYRIGGINSVRGFRTFDISGPFGGTERSRHENTRVFVDSNGNIRTIVEDDRIGDLSFEDLKQLQSGGIQQRIFNLEMLFPLSQDEQSFVRGVVFYDAGNVNAEKIQYELLGEKEPDFFELRHSAGLGLRLITPVGVLRFEYGYKLDRREGEKPDRFDFHVSGLF